MTPQPTRFRRPGLHASLAIAALALGALALLAEPHPGHVVAVDTHELALAAADETSRVTPNELADWIVKGRVDYRLLDLRESSAYKVYHVPTAESFPLPVRLDHAVDRNETIIVYSDAEFPTAQAWFLLRARGYRSVYWLAGGLDGWKREVLFPSLPAEPLPADALRVAHAHEVSRYFGGKARSGDESEAQSTPIELPRPDVVPHVAPHRKMKKRKGGGCG